MDNRDDSSPATDRLAHQLARSGAWPANGSSVEWIQTHISHVFLVGERVYKLRKDVVLPFLDFGTRSARNADCLREIALNRRLAPAIYLGVAPVLAGNDSVRVGPVAESITDAGSEHVVVMRRLAAGRDALTLLEHDRLGASQLEAVAERLQSFHACQGLGRPAPWSRDAWQDRIAQPMLACLDALTETGLAAGSRLAALESRTREVLARLAPRFEERRLEGRAVDGHGDLHLDHVWFETADSDPLLIDCVEFSDDLRRIDSAAEVAFLAMDLRYRGRADLADAFLAAYATPADDTGLFAVVNFYAAYRALVRAKVAGLAAIQSSIEAEQQEKARGSVERHLALAESLLEPPDRGSLLLMCGSVGCGKSSVARSLARSGRGIPIASDRVRKVLAGIASDAHPASAPDEGIYEPALKDRVYRALLERALPVIASGRTAILDASFARRARRDLARAWAAEHGIPIRLIEVRCEPGIARDRLRERSRLATDPSDAGPDFLPASLARFEPPKEWPAADREVIRTDDPRCVLPRRRARG